MYRCTSTCSALNYSSWILLIFCALYTKLCSHTFSPILESSQFFWLQFSNIVASPSDEYGQSLALLKMQSRPKKAMKTASKLTDKPWHKTCSNYVPSNELRRQTGAWQADKNIYRHHILAPTFGARCSMSPNLCMAVKDVEAILKDGNWFSIQHSVFLRGRKMLLFASE